MTDEPSHYLQHISISAPFHFFGGDKMGLGCAPPQYLEKHDLWLTQQPVLSPFRAIQVP